MFAFVVSSNLFIWSCLMCHGAIRNILTLTSMTKDRLVFPLKCRKSVLSLSPQYNEIIIDGKATEGLKTSGYQYTLKCTLADVE